MHIAQSWRLKGQRYALKGTKCHHCQQAIFPPREVCPHCQAINPVQFDLEQPRTITLPQNTPLQRAAR